jgi:hypothetical protein
MSDAFLELWTTFAAFLGQLATVLAILGRALLPWLPLGVWCAWWLWCVNWKRAFPVLAKGGWVPVVLLVFTSALAWSGVSPSKYYGMPNFWWQLVACTALALVALLCGWLQGRFNWTPAEVSFDPPADHGDHGHHAHH